MEGIKDQERILSKKKRPFFIGARCGTFKYRWHQETQPPVIKPTAFKEDSSISIFSFDHPNSRRLFKATQV
jgi:hypothetical protein